MKTLIILLLLPVFAGAQDSNGFNINGLSLGFGGIPLRCGTWEKQSDTYSDWIAIDTLGSKNITTKLRDWAYDDELALTNGVTLAVYDPCGVGSKPQWVQMRVCKITGIRQKRTRNQNYKYIEPPKSEYQKTVEKFSK